MSRHDLRITLLQMRDHAAEAIALARGCNREALEEDRLLNLSLARLVEIVGKAAYRVPIEARQQHAAIPWAEFIGMRHRLVHGYDQVDLDVLWHVVTIDRPPLVLELDRAIACQQ